MSIYKPYGIEIQPDGAGSPTLIGGITQQSILNNQSISSPTTAGMSSPGYAEVSEAESGGTFTSHNIRAMLDALGNRGACMNGSGFAVYQLLKTDCGSIAAGDVHRKVTINNGRSVPRQLSVQHGQRATMSGEVFALRDGANDPVGILEGQAAPVGVTDDFGFHLGAIQLGGVPIQRVMQLDVDFGLTVNRENDDGEVVAGSLSIDDEQPKLSIRGRKVDLFGNTPASQIPFAGVHATHANSFVTLRRKLKGTANYMTGAEHIRGTLDGLVVVKEMSASANSPWDIMIEVTPLQDGTNDWVAWDTAYEIA